MRLITFSIICVLVAAPVPAEKKRAWQTGKLLDTEESSVYRGSSASGSATASRSGSTTTATGSSRSTENYDVYQTYRIELGEHTYHCVQTLRWRWSKAANVTVNGPVQVFIEKKNLYIKDEDGKEHKTEILKKVLNAPAKAQP